MGIIVNHPAPHVSFADLLVKLRSNRIEAHAIPRMSRGARDGADRAVAGAIYDLYRK